MTDQGPEEVAAEIEGSQENDTTQVERDLAEQAAKIKALEPSYDVKKMLPGLANEDLKLPGSIEDYMDEFDRLERAEDAGDSEKRRRKETSSSTRLKKLESERQNKPPPRNGQDDKD